MLDHRKVSSIGAPFLADRSGGWLSQSTFRRNPESQNNRRNRPQEKRYGGV